MANRKHRKVMNGKQETQETNEAENGSVPFCSWEKLELRLPIQDRN